MNGAARESRHVFLEAGLQQIRLQNIRIFEVGFETGLNALLTWGFAGKNHLQIDYDTIPVFVTIFD